MEETTDVKRKITPSIPANYVSILQLKERWIKEKDRNRKEQEDEEERRRKQHAEEHQKVEEEEDLKKQEDLDESRSDQKHNSKNDESIDCGESRWGEKEEIRSERGGGDEGLPEKKRGRKKRYHRKKKKRETQEVAVVDECGSIEPVKYTVTTENNTPVKDQIRVYKKKGESVEKAVTAIETQFEHLSIKRSQETKNLKAQTRSRKPNQSNQIHTPTMVMVWVKKGQDERVAEANGSGLKPLKA